MRLRSQGSSSCLGIVRPILCAPRRGPGLPCRLLDRLIGDYHLSICRTLAQEPLNMHSFGIYQWLSLRLSRRKAGRQCLLDLYGCPFGLLDSTDFVVAALVEAAELGRTTLLNHLVHRFNPQGVTAVGILAESHLSIHTWPDMGYAAIDIFTCGNSALPRPACMYLASQFCAANFDLTEFSRYYIQTK